MQDVDLAILCDLDSVRLEVATDLVEQAGGKRPGSTPTWPRRCARCARTPLT
jgi:hypothetical protein